jgi:hypothetical protein
MEASRAVKRFRRKLLRKTVTYSSKAVSFRSTSRELRGH